MDGRFLWADADGFLGSVVIQQEDLTGLTVTNQAGWDDEEDEDDWEDEDWEDEEDDEEDDDWD